MLGLATQRLGAETRKEVDERIEAAAAAQEKAREQEAGTRRGSRWTSIGCGTTSRWDTEALRHEVTRKLACARSAATPTSLKNAHISD